MNQSATNICFLFVLIANTVAIISLNHRLKSVPKSEASSYQAGFGRPDKLQSRWQMSPTTNVPMGFWERLQRKDGSCVLVPIYKATNGLWITNVTEAMP